MLEMSRFLICPYETDELAKIVHCCDVSGWCTVILAKLARVVPLALLEHHDVLRKALECMDPLSLGTATHLLLALNPLLKMNMTLKDALMIILRKMLFSRLATLILLSSFRFLLHASLNFIVC